MTPFPLLQEMKDLPPRPPLGSALSPAEVQVSLLIPARNAGHSLEETVRQAHAFFLGRYGQDFEIVLIPNPKPGNSQDRSIEIAHDLARKFPRVRVVVHLDPQGKGAALRSGVFEARGRWIFFTDADLPYDLDFFDAAAGKLRAGYGLVHGNRRLLESHFNIPVSLLSLAYARHRLGLAFNRVVRLFMPIRTSDTQAGIKAMTRELALQAFSLQRCPGFLFDLEIFLTARAQGYRVSELPITLYLNTEKSTVRVLKECILVAFWISRIAWRNRKNAYLGSTQATQESRAGLPAARARSGSVLRRYRHASPGTRFFLSLRWRMTPYSEMASYLPREGAVLDLGCGHGLFAFAAASGSASRKVVGLDHDPERIRLARLAASGPPNLANLEFHEGSLLESGGSDRFAGAALIDVMHYFDFDEQRRIIEKAVARLAPGGVLLVREVNPEGGVAAKINRTYEKVATGIGFTRSDRKVTHFFRKPEEWVELLNSCGLTEVEARPCSHPLFADVLFIGIAPAGAAPAKGSGAPA